MGNRCLTIQSPEDCETLPFNYANSHTEIKYQHILEAYVAVRPNLDIQRPLTSHGDWRHDLL